MSRREKKQMGRRCCRLLSILIILTYTHRAMYAHPIQSTLSHPLIWKRFRCEWQFSNEKCAHISAMSHLKWKCTRHMSRNDNKGINRAWISVTTTAFYTINETKSRSPLSWYSVLKIDNHVLDVLIVFNSTRQFNRQNTVKPSEAKPS